MYIEAPASPRTTDTHWWRPQRCAVLIKTINIDFLMSDIISIQTDMKECFNIVGFIVTLIFYSQCWLLVYRNKLYSSP